MKPLLYSLLIAFVMGSMVVLKACKTQPKNASTEKNALILAYVGNEPITVGEFRYLYEKNNNNDSTAYSLNDLQEYLNLFVSFKRKVAQAKALGYDTTKEYRTEFAEYKKQLAKPYLSVTAHVDKMVKEAYQRLQEEINASHILIKCPRDASAQDTLAAFKKIQELHRRALAGEDFGQLAADYSDDISTKKDKGNVGYFTALQMVYEFETVAYNTPVGQVSQIFRTQFGYHILKVLDRRPNRGSIKVAHIMARFPPKATAADSAATLERIKAIRERLLKGASWDSLCMAYSDDLNTREIGGELQWFSVGMMIPSFAEPAFQLQQPGDISPPVMTPYGWHLIKLKERRPIEPFNELEPILRQKVNKDSRGQIGRNYLIAKLKKENQWIENPQVKQLVLSMPDETILKGEWNYDRASKNLEKVVFTIKGKPYLVRDALMFMENNQGTGQRPGTVLKNFVNDLYEKFVAQSLIDYEEAHLEEKYPEYSYLLNEYREGMLLFKIMEERVWGKALTDKEGLQKFFDENRSRYQWPERAKASIFTVASPSLLERLKKEYHQDYYLDHDLSGMGKMEYKLNALQPDSASTANLKKLVQFLKRDTTTIVEMSATYAPKENRRVAQERLQYLRGEILAEGIASWRVTESLQSIESSNLPQASLKIYGRNKKIMVDNFNREMPLSVQWQQGLFGKGENPIVDATPWQVGAYEVKQNDKLHWVIIHEIQPSRLKELNEVRGTVIADYQRHLEAEWLKELQQLYPLQLNQKVFNQLVRKK
ncbi:MAG: peptidylprolyl isomerase [Cytophagales bacterium]|nr:peptidylprolyl isomerase [Bernardetiaceae bacterium]MDW8211287.1 peptidylprolyl isomerase [Cytophagales bacterium]